MTGLEIEEELGRGAHSVVYRGRLHGVPCAVKRPRAKSESDQWIYREAISLARVAHPGLPKVIDVDQVEGVPHLVMELVEGPTLAERLRRQGRLDESTVVDLAFQLIDALAAVHEAGLVHRDVKPRNIIVEAATGVLRLVDFGFATTTGRAAGRDLAGTPGYSAPEQVLPPYEVDGRADLYALGGVLFECLTGIAPAHGGDLHGALSTNCVGRELAEVVVRLLAKRRDDRYPSARALDADLTRLGFTSSRTRLSGAPGVPIRQGELEKVISSFSRVKEQGAAVALVGERGSGKSRLLRSAESALTDRTAISRIQCREDDAPLAVLRSIVDAYAVDVAESERSAVRNAVGPVGVIARLVGAAALSAVLADAAAHELPSLQKRQTVPSEALVEGAAELLLRLAKLKPMIHCIDDAHWMDPASLEGLRHAVHRLPQMPIGFLLALRNEASGPRVLEVMATIRGASTVSVPRLTDAQSTSLVAAYLGAAAIDSSLAERVWSLADGTPLGVIEVVQSFLDGRALRPRGGRWDFDGVRAATVSLPSGALVMLGHRLAELGPSGRRFLEVAAVIGRAFDVQLVGEVLGVRPDEVASERGGNRREGLIEPDGDGRDRFVHDSLREALLSGLSPSTREALHERVGGILWRREGLSFEETCDAARHLIAGGERADAASAYEASRAAGDGALQRFDNDSALWFYGQARRMATVAGRKVEGSLLACEGEAGLRAGAFDASIAAFEKALVQELDRQQRARILGRLAWIHECRADPTRAWTTLERAFGELGVRMPKEDARSAAATALRVAESAVNRLVTRSGERKAKDDLCHLHYLNARFGLENGKAARVLQSGAACFALSKEAALPEARARAQAFYAFAMTTLGRRDERVLRLAKDATEMSRSTDLATRAFCVQLESVVRSWRGEIDVSLALTRECVDELGPWLERGEYLQDSGSGDMMSSVRGHATEAWAWIDRGIERVRRSGAAGSDSAFIFLRARALLVLLGRTVENDPWLERAIVDAASQTDAQGYHRAISVGPRARYFLDAEELGDEFEAFVQSIEAEYPTTRGAHVGVLECLMAIAHARVHQWLRAAPSERRSLLPRVRRAALRLAAGANSPLFGAHGQYAEAALAWCEGRDAEATKLLAKTDAFAIEHNMPWVRYSVARVRAHMLRAAGKESAACDEARVAELLAREYGAAARVRCIRREFDLGPAPGEEHSSSRSSSRTKRQLAAVVNMARAPRRELEFSQQAGAMLDELMTSLRAQRGSLWFVPEADATPVVVVRERNLGGIAATEAAIAHLRSVHQSAESSIAERSLAVPLFLYERAVGALQVERGESDASFAAEDRTLLGILSHQVPIGLEMSRLLSEREQVQSSLQHAAKMEALGTLAGGLAHDFNNMLATMNIAVSVARRHASEPVADELDVIAGASKRASDLTNRLLGFSRHQAGPLTVHDVNELLQGLEPMLERVVGPTVDVVLALSATPARAVIDPVSFDQAIVNLAMNARDAMDTHGMLSIRVAHVELDETRAASTQLPAGKYVHIEVADTGKGMSAETMARIFEPFFTTKRAGTGSGLGLAMAYAFARNAGGAVRVDSEVGHGTRMHVYLKSAGREAVAARDAQPSSTARSGDAVLLVDDNAPLREIMARLLEEQGYRVLAAGGAADALVLARENRSRIRLVIVDMLLPDATGLELARRIDELDIAANRIFMSGYSPLDVPETQLLLKPFTQEALLERVRALME